MTCGYNVEGLFNDFLSRVDRYVIRSSNSPYPVYSTVDEYLSSDSDFKGLVVWDTIRYYAGDIIKTLRDDYNTYVDFYVIPELGQIQIRDNIEFYAVFTISVDVLYQKDRFGQKQLRYINFVINEYRNRFEHGDIYIGGIKIFTKFMNMSKQITNDKFNQYVRRTLTFWIRYCCP